jgi:hypothetical protein
LGGLGQVGSDGKRYAALPDGATVEVTPYAPRKFYTWDESATKHRLLILANGSNCQTEFFFQSPRFIVGQYVTFEAAWDPAPPGISNSSAQWKFDGDYLNDKTNALPAGSMPTSSDVYFTNPNLLTNDAVPDNWWVSGGTNAPDWYAVNVKKDLIFNNGQSVHLHEDGGIAMWRPSSTVAATAGVVSLDTNMVGATPNGCVTNFGLHYGNPGGPCGGVPGMVLSNFLTVPSGFGGTIQWVQVITNTLRRFQTNDGSGAWCRYEHSAVLDGGQPVAINPFMDSPGGSIDCLDTLGRYKAKAFVILDNFETCLEFMPTTGPSGPIDRATWVPLRNLAWSWSCAASFVGTNCSPTGWVLTDASNPLPAEKNPTYLLWTNRLENIPVVYPQE